MDTTDSKIVFDENGVCDYCRNYDKNIKPFWKPQQNRLDELEKLAVKIRKEGKRGKYDCILGLSGGADSSYLAYIAKEIMHLRPLALVIDTGWNLNVAVENIERVVKGLDLDMYTIVADWKEMQDKQLAFLKSQVPNQDIQDGVIFAGLYNYAVKNKIKYVLTGSNNATEFIRPPIEWMYMHDMVLEHDIQKKYGKKKKLVNLPECGMLRYKILYPYLYGMKRIYPLDYIIYDKSEAEKMLHEKYGWEKYANKHYENVFTRWYEGYYMPMKFGYDTRKNVLSNQILIGAITRDEALEKLKNPPYDPEQAEQDTEYIAKKLGVPLDEFTRIIHGKNKTYKDYRNMEWIIRAGIKISQLLGIEKRNLRF